MNQDSIGNYFFVVGYNLDIGHINQLTNEFL